MDPSYKNYFKCASNVEFEIVFIFGIHNHQPYGTAILVPIEKKYFVCFEQMHHVVTHKHQDLGYESQQR